MAEDKEDTPSMAVEAPEKPSDERKLTPKGKVVGRPRKADVASKKPGGRKKVGRPKGEKAIMDEYKARLLNSPKSRKVLDKVIEVAMTDDHPHQGTCLKLVTERILPQKSFEDFRGNSGPQVQIIFEGMAGEASVIEGKRGDREDPLDAEYVEVSDDDQ